MWKYSWWGASKIFHLFNFNLLYDLALDGFQKNLVYDLVFDLVFDLVYGWYMLGMKNEPKNSTMIENVWSGFPYSAIRVVWEKTGMACYKAFFDTAGLCDTRGYKK